MADFVTYPATDANFTGSIMTSDHCVILTPVVIKCIYLTIGVLGLLANTMVVVVIFSSDKMRIHRTNIYIINQSLIDATVALFLILTTIFENDDRYFEEENLADVVHCKLWLNKVWLWSFLDSSTHNIMALTFERYLAIVHCIWHKVKLTKVKVAVSIMTVWLIGPAYNMAYMIPTTEVESDGNCSVYSHWPSERVKAAVGIITVIFQFFFPLCFLIVCYSLIARDLRHRLLARNNSIRQNEASTRNISKAKVNIIRTVFIVSLCFILCWTPNQFYYFLFHLNAEVASDFTSASYHVTVILVFCSCCINPFIYVAQYKAFQEACCNVFRRAQHGLRNCSETSGK